MYSFRPALFPLRSKIRSSIRNNLFYRYVHCLYGRTHLDLPEEEKRRLRLEKGENIDPNKEFLKMAGLSADDLSRNVPSLSSTSANLNSHRSYVHISEAELHGIKYVVMYLHHLPASKKNVPLMLPDPVSVIRDIRQLVLDHKDDNKDQAITGKYILRWNETDDVDHIKKPRKHVPKVPSEQRKNVKAQQPSQPQPQPALMMPPIPTDSVLLKQD